MEEISGSSHHGQAEPAAAVVPAQVMMSAGEIVKLLPILSPGLSLALTDYLVRCTDVHDGMLVLDVRGREVEAVLELCEGFAVELEALARQGSRDVILQLSWCLLFALAPSVPNARGIHILGDATSQRTYGGEQAVEVLYSALVSQHSSNVRQLILQCAIASGTDRACEHLAHLLKSRHCKLQQLLIMENTTMGAGGMRHIARALRTNSSLTLLTIDQCQVGDGGMEQLAAMLRINSSLEVLTLLNIGMTVQGLGHLCHALSTQQSLPATSSSPSGTMPNGHMGGLKELYMSNNYMIGEGGAALLGDMLAKNRCLRSLNVSHCSLVEEDGEGHLANGLRENSTLEELDISDNRLGKVALGLLTRCLATNNTSLKELEMNNMREMPAAEELAHMVAYNHSLVDLRLREASYDAGEWSSVILPALGRNKTLLSIDLRKCQGVEGQLVRGALFDLLHINTTIQEIDLVSTPLDDSGEAAAVQVELRRNVKFRHALSGLPQAKPKSCRVVLCGHAYAGKSSLFETMKLLQPNSHAATPFLFGLLWSLLVFVFGFLSRMLLGHHNLKDKELNKRTRGIEIHLLKDEEDCRISVWDLAGQREFHALHDFMFPNGDNAATLFVLTFSPIVSPADEQRAGKVKTMEELEEELLYWLRFIASNSKPSAAPPTVVVVITHKDTLLRLGTNVNLWLLCAQDIITDLVARFAIRVKVQPRPFMVNARAINDVELRRWAEVVETLLRSTLDGLKEEPAICNHVLRAVQDVSRTRSNSPIISTTEFANICSSKMAAEMANVKEANNVDDEGPADPQSPVGESEVMDQTHEEVNIVMENGSEVEEADSKSTVGESEAQDKASEESEMDPTLVPESDSEVEEEADSKSNVGKSEAQDQAYEEFEMDPALIPESESEAEEDDDSESTVGKSEAQDQAHEEFQMESKLEVDDEAGIIGGKIGRAVAAYLHDAGEVIQHDKLDLIVSNPKWFGHGVLGQLIDIFDSSQDQESRPFLLAWCRKRAERFERPKNGLVSMSYLSQLLKEAVKSVPGLDTTVVTPDQLIQLMLLLDLCYERTPGDPNAGYLLPAIFDDEGNKAADGKRPLTWRELDTSTFVGRRLQCGDLDRTFLTDGFFPRLQVVLHNHAFKEKWVENNNRGNYTLEKNLFSIWVNGMEILIEFSGSTGYFVDILVKSSKSHQQTMEFLRRNIMGTIRIFCASQEGCQGVTLAEAIIRPDCLYGADGGNPILCTYRRDQSVLVEKLTEKMKEMPDYEHCWNKVKDGAGGLVLRDGQHSGIVLQEGTKDVTLGREPNHNHQRVEEVCYPSNCRIEGKTRGLALIVSMEKGRPGGELDRGRLEAFALACEFRKVVLVDPVASDLAGIINSVVEEDVLEEDECFLCSISGHGGIEDGKQFLLDQEKLRIMLDLVIVNPFRRSKHLRGKPKIFLINCCRGAMIYDNSDTVEANANVQQVTGSPLPHVTELSDCLRVFSTSEGCPSCRDELTGTVFVNQLMETVMENKETTDVLSMMTMVNERVNEVQSTMEDPNTKTKVKVGQCCEVRHTLRKRLYWKAA